ncbi:hypothetical protein [Microbulbifer rhizosphaerae]|uniref:Uncharacterized protein n=1 Tax=Microbulbifer rhizosphaerae TaxID=1562603 RepID=A0A7W4ZBI2_9GAMM|nr:hypothetical protein [Microbulbifer rhizosphaerae]MBB3062335.1 hypothetical protein [Microbulbifer rhizosphaerae]
MRTEEIDAFETCVKNKLKLISEYGFTYSGVEVSEFPTLGKAYAFQFKSESSDRMLSIAFMSKGKSPRDIVITKIYQNPDLSTEKNDYERSLSVEIKTRKFYELTGDFKSRVVEYISGVEEILSKNYVDIISGKVWKPDSPGFGGSYK